MNPRQILQVLSACRSAMELLARKANPGQYHPGFVETAKMIDEGFLTVAKTTVLVYPGLRRAVKRGVAGAADGLKLYEQNHSIFALQTCLTVFTNLITEKFNRDWQLQSPALLVTGSAVSSHADITGQLLQKLKAAGFVIDTNISVESGRVGFAEFDVPLSFMGDEEIERKFGTTRTQVEAAIRSAQRCIQTVSILDGFIREIREKFRPVLLVAAAATIEGVDARLMAETERLLAEIGPLELYAGMDSLYEQAVAQLGVIAAPICVDWGCSGLESTILTRLSTEGDKGGVAATKRVHTFGQTALDRILSTETLHTDLLCQHGQVLDDIPEGVDQQFGLATAMHILEALPVAHDGIFFGETIAATMQEKQASFLASDPTIGSLVLEGVRLNMADRAAFIALSTQGTVVNWLFFLAEQAGLFSDRKEMLTGRVQALLRSVKEAHEVIAQMGATFNLAKLTPGEAEGIKAIDRGEEQATRAAQDQLASQCMASNTLHRGAQALVRSYQKAIKAMDAGKVQSLTDQDVADLREKIRIVNTIVEGAEPALAELNAKMVQLLLELGFTDLATTVEAMFA